MTATMRVTSLDEFFLNLSDSAEMSIQFEVRVSGRLDVDRLAAALRTAVARHPIARARLGRTSARATRHDWEFADQPDHLALEVTDEPAAVVRSRLYSRAPDLSRSPVFAAALVRGTGDPDDADPQADGGDLLLLNLHHAAFDGLSAVRLTTSIARAYAGADDPVGGPPLERARDLRRLAGSRRIGEVAGRAAMITRDYVERRRLLRVAADDGVPGGTAEPRFGFEQLVLDAEQTAALAAAKPAGTTLNDVAIGAFCLAMLRWNRAHDAARADTVSIMMPVNLRPAEWSAEVVSNFASYLAIVLPTSVPDDLMSAASAAAGRTRPLKENGSAGWIVDVLEPGNAVPTLIKRNLQTFLPLVQSRFVETAVLSNLGRVAIPDFGEAGPVRRVWFSPPCLTSLMPVVVGVAGVAGELHLSLRFNRAQIGDAAARRFADLLLDVLHEGTTPVRD